MMQKHTPISFRQVRISDGFWKDRQSLNANVTIHAVRERFEETGRFSAYEGHWREGKGEKPRLYLTGDIEKWIESVAYLVSAGNCEELLPLCDHIISCIEQNQYPDGYYNMWLMQTDPANRWTNRDWHELYAAGHLLEAAVAYYESTGKDTLLQCACRLADHIEQVFVKEQSAAFFTPGHPEIELALVKLYRCTGEKRYLALSKHFLDARGQHGEERIPADYGRFAMCNGYDDQTHAPVREQNTAEGHAVRAGYLYSGMADVAYECEDDALLAACRRIFDNIAQCRMYITGGVGSTAMSEAFTMDYDLPNPTAYTESCAAISLMMFARRMMLFGADSRYADVVERVLYNGFLSSTGLAGDSFFYENPLEIDPKLRKREPFALTPSRMPIMERVKVFYVSCCPPNITRLVASLGDYLYTCNEDTVFIHQYMDSTTEIMIGGAPAVITQHTDYPRSGTIRLSVIGDGVKQVAVRIPGWCSNWSVSGAGTYTVKDGYAYFNRPDGECTLCFDMTPFAVEASPHVQDNAGRIAIQRGPVVYCLEGVDNGNDLRDIHIDLSKPITEESCAFCGIPTLQASGWRRDPEPFENSLYRRISDARKEQDLRLIPYFSFANRGETEMIVWILP